LHGGVISSLLDVTGGLAAFVSLLKRMGHVSTQEKMERLSKFSTIDIRVDFLNPGRGKFFVTTATVLRTGNKVAVTRMELHNDDNLLIALGTGTYMVV
ncbi:MAG TPA: thioesterase family protein, partial [bacterium]